MSLREHWIGQFKGLGEQQDTFVVPYRYGDAGWFDYQPLSPIYPVALWNLSMQSDDWKRVEALRAQSNYDWKQVFSFRTKEDAGHEQPWVRFLAGDNPSYPEQILQATYTEVCRRLAQIRQDETAATHNDVHRWQEVNPVSTEALVQLTCGGPQMIYNGGLPMVRLRYFDPTRRRPGLPADVAALVEKLEVGRTVVRLVNVSPFAERRVLVQGGAFGEHRFTEVRYRERISEYPGTFVDYAAPSLETRPRTATVQDRYLQVVLPPATEVVLELGTELFAYHASSGMP
jgi:hypothetical protein